MFSYTWRSRIDSQQVDNYGIEFLGEGLSAQGQQLTDKYVARWQLTAPSNWTTSHFSFSVTVQGKDNWSSSIATSGNQPTGLPAPGLDAGVDLSSALDTDVGRCPMTNTMPIRWLGRLEKDVACTPFIMAWIDMPSLRVIASDHYSPSASKSSVRYESGTRDVNVHLKVDINGVVLDYPDIAR